ncbi:MAG TPA: hypothetical protein DDZ60_11775 [Planktothrix sp. UBA10369]|jgi:Serine/threonine protein kinase|nr:hypothetical protein [Planktothrix sp. UBA8402]HBK23151.1 hypothetical protein [Planktothrix sp. UBA10369]
MNDQQDDDSNNSGLGDTNKEDTEKIHQNFGMERKNQEDNPFYWQPGHRLNDNPEYEIEKSLKAGGFGITYLAKDEKGKICVIKILKEYSSEKFISKKQQRDLRQEGIRLANCRHPHIVKVNDILFEGGKPCLVMEYIPGDNLCQIVNKQGILSEKEAIYYIRQIGKALIHIHQLDPPVYHRDVKPANIIIRSDTSQAVLIDFGIARECYPGEPIDLTAFSSFGYTPIEQHRRDSQQGPYTEVHALAGTLYFLLTGTQPEDSIARADCVLKGEKDPLKSPKGLNPKVSNAVDIAILKGMAISCTSRPQSVQEWLDLLPKPESKKTAKSSPSQHNPPQRSRPAPVPPPIPNPPVIQPEKLPSSPVTDWGLYVRTALMGAGVWLIAIALFYSPSIANKGALIAVGIILWGISLFWKNHSSLGQKILQHIFSLLSSCLIYLFLNFLKLEASSIIFLAPISAILAMTMMAMAELFITSDSEES